MLLSATIILCLSVGFAQGFVIPKKHSNAVFQRFSATRYLQKQPWGRGTPAMHFAKESALELAGTNTRSITMFFLKNIISLGVPIMCIVAAYFLLKYFDLDMGDDDDGEEDGELYDDLYDTKKGKRMLWIKKRPENFGVPKEQFISVTNVNKKLDSYHYSMDTATKSKAAAASVFRTTNFYRALHPALSSEGELQAGEKMELLDMEEDFLVKAGKLTKKLTAMQSRLTESVVRKGKSERNFKTDTMGHTLKALAKLELKFLQDVVKVLGPERAQSILGNETRGVGELVKQIEQRPLSAILDNLDGEKRTKSLFVVEFPGDAAASQVNGFREEVTAILQSSQPGDEVLMLLQSGGGTVTGYGLAAGQLQRFKDKGMKLTICVEEIAASGGYMMCCTADKIIASPMAALGSIGVVMEVPNAYHRLKKEGMEFLTVTAGKFKRTLTPTKKVTEEDFEKTKEELEEVYTLFKDFVKENRPSLDIEKVATGEVWYGMDALERGLCDEIKTFDEVILDYVGNGYNVFEIKFDPVEEASPANLFCLPNGRSSRSLKGLLARVVSWFVQAIALQLSESTRRDLLPERRHMLLDDHANRVRFG